MSLCAAVDHVADCKKLQWVSAVCRTLLHNQAGRQANRQTHRQIGRQTDRHAGRRIERETVRQRGKQADGQTGRQT